MFKGKKGQAAGGTKPSGIDPSAVVRGAGSIGKSVLGAAKTFAPVGGGVTGAAAKLASGALGGILPGLGFGVGTNLSNTAFQSVMGIRPLIIAILFDVFAFVTGEFNPLFGAIWHAILAWVLIKKYFPGDGFLNLVMRMKFVVACYILLIAFLPQFLTFASVMPRINYWIFITIGNHAFPIATFYVIFSGFISNRSGGILVQAIYVISFFALIFWAYDMAQDEINEKLVNSGVDVKSMVPEGQKQIFTTFVAQLSHSFRTTGGQFLQAAINSPKQIGGFFNGRVEAATGAELFGEEKKEQPKLGIVLHSHPNPVIEVGDKLQAKAIITIENPLIDRNFLTVTDMSCWQEGKNKKKVKGEILEFNSEALTKGVYVFYGDSKTITCQFDNAAVSKSSPVYIAVDYDFTSNIKLNSYLMKDELLESLRIRQEDPLDYMAVPEGRKKPIPRFDNGPAKFGIGPIELWNPPLGIADNKVYPAFEFAVGNNPSFNSNGKISKIREILINMPRGMKLREGDKTCFFQPTGVQNQYATIPQIIQDNVLQFTEIESQERIYLCNMDITVADALGTGSSSSTSFIDVEFDVNVDYTYQVQKIIPLSGSIIGTD